MSIFFFLPRMRPAESKVDPLKLLWEVVRQPEVRLCHLWCVSSDIHTAHILNLHCKHWPAPSDWAVPLWQISPLGILLLDRSRKTGYLCWQVSQPQVKPPHWTPFTASSLWDVRSGILPLFSLFFKPQNYVCVSVCFVTVIGYRGNM